MGEIMDKEIILVTGLGRSGTSLLSGMLHKYGLFMGDNLFYADEGNPNGYYEDQNFIYIYFFILM